MSLVVKKGSNTLATTSSLMPQPVSRMLSITYSPGSGSSGRCGRALIRVLRVDSVS
ncbi:hypothetical protein D3C79_562740 [compost metagenome]